MTITAELVGFILLLMGAAAAAWFRIEAGQRTVKSDMSTAMSAIIARSELTAAQLHEHKVHVAETYVSKQGLREQMEPLFDAVKDVGGQVRHMSERLDRVFEPPRMSRDGKPST